MNIGRGGSPGTLTAAALVTLAVVLEPSLICSMAASLSGMHSGFGSNVALGVLPELHAVNPRSAIAAMVIRSIPPL